MLVPAMEKALNSNNMEKAGLVLEMTTNMGRVRIK